MPASVLQHLVLRKAASVCGSEAALSRILKVSGAELRSWMDGKAAPPLRIFNQAIKLVNDAYHAPRRIVTTPASRRKTQPR
jgi:hypothetical protein